MYPSAAIPEATIASAFPRTAFSSTAQPSAFQLLQPIGGVGASDGLPSVSCALAVAVPITSTEMARAHATDRFIPQCSVVWAGSARILIQM